MSEKLSKRGRRIIGIFGVCFGSLFLIAGLSVVYGAVKRGMAQRATMTWSQVSGTLIEFESHRKEDEKRQSPVAYRYEVGGKIYRSNRVAYVDGNNLEYGDWLGLANGLPESGSVDVYYDPGNPSESVLIRGGHSASWQGVGFGALFAGFALVWMTVWWTLSNWLPDRLEKESTTES